MGDRLSTSGNATGYVRNPPEPAGTRRNPPGAGDLWQPGIPGLMSYARTTVDPAA